MNLPAFNLAQAAYYAAEAQAERDDAVEARLDDALSDRFDEALRRPTGDDYRKPFAPECVADVAETIYCDDRDWLAEIMRAYYGLGPDLVEGTVAAMMERARVLWASNERRRQRVREELARLDEANRGADEADRRGLL